MGSTARAQLGITQVIAGMLRERSCNKSLLSYHLILVAVACVLSRLTILNDRLFLHL